MVNLLGKLLKSEQMSAQLAKKFLNVAFELVIALFVQDFKFPNLLNFLFGEQIDLLISNRDFL